VSETARHSRQNRGRGPTPLPDSAVRQRPHLLCAGILLGPLGLFDVWLQIYWSEVYLLGLYLLELYLLADRHAGKLCPLIAEIQHFAHLIEELRMRVVVPPATGIAKFDEVLLPTLDQGQPSAGDTVVRTSLPFRHEASQSAVESARVDSQRASLIRATKMNAAPPRLFVDFLFVDQRV
jgi:hypothetical protein